MLITGGLGFIGSNLAQRLVQEGAEVTVVDSLVPEYGGNLFNIEPIRNCIRVNLSDVRDPYAFRALVQGQHVLFNLAGQTSHLDSMTDPFTDLEINARAQLSILEACRKENPEIRVVFASTRQIYGRPLYLPVDEKHPLQPVDVNGIHKMAGESYHTLFANVYGLRTCSLRLTNTYGPRMRIRDARQTFLGIWLRKVIQKEPFEVWGGEQVRDFSYVDDCVEALLLAAIGDATIGKVYNLGGPERISLLDLGRLLVRIHGEGSFTSCEFPPDRKRIDIGDYYSDYSSFSRETGWHPQVSLEEGLRRSISFYSQHLASYL